MRSKFLLFVSLAAILFCNGCAPKLAPVGHYQNAPISIDGDITDWGLPLRYSNPEYNLQYSVTNDLKNLYVCVYSKDQTMELRILRSGVDIYFDTKGEKNKTMSLDYPIRKPADQPPHSYGDPVRTTDLNAEKNQLLLQSDYYNTTGFVNFENGQFSTSDPKTNIQVAAKIHEDSSLVYEAAIPLNLIFGTDMRPAYASENFSVGLVVNSWPSNPRNTGGSNYPHSSYGGMRGMGMHGGGMGGGGRNYNSAPKPEENWVQFRLVYNKPDPKK
jgi:hypothetical protein